MDYEQREKIYVDHLAILLDRWTREMERSVWSDHYESEKNKIDLCFDFANTKSREVYGINEKFLSESIEPVIESTVDPEVIREEPIIFTDVKPKDNFRLIWRDLVAYVKEPIAKENIPEQPTRPAQPAKTSIVNLSLSSHIHNKLHENNIKTLEDLLSLNQTQIESILFYSEKLLLELIIELNHLNIKHNFILSKNILSEILPNSTIKKEKNKPLKPVTAKDEEWEEIEYISDLTFSPRVHGRLKSVGIKTIDDLLSYSTAKLLDIPSFGRTHLKVIIDELDESDIKHSFVMPNI